MSSPEWTYQLVDLMGGELLAEVPMSGASYTKRLNKAGAFSGTVHLDEKLARRGIDFYDITTPARRAVYVLRDGWPQWGGILWTRKYSSSAGTIKLGAGDWWSYFDHRKVLPVLPTDPAVDYVAGTSTDYLDAEQNEIARRLVKLAQSHTGGDIGVQLDTSSSGIWRDRHYYGYELHDVGDALTKLCNVVNGPDLMFDVGLDADGRVTRTLRIGTPTLGQQGSPHVWEYGGRGNLRSYEWPSDGSSMATRVLAVGDGLEAGTPIAVSEDNDRYNRGWPLLELEQGYSSVTTTSVLQSHADSDQRTARLPVVLPALTVGGDPQIGTYGPGDDARIVIRDEFHRNGLDAPMRIIEQQVQPGDEAGDQAVLTMAPLLESAGIY